MNEAQEARWTAVQEGREALAALRREVAEREQALAAAEEAAEGEAEAAEGAAMPTPAELEAEITAKKAEAQAKADELIQNVVDFLNAENMEAGLPPTERQLEAIRIKSAEDMVLAQEYIDKGGDYRRAIDIYNAALQLDPDNEELKARLADAEANRYMSQERFAAAKKGMTQKEIRKVLGQVNLHNVREYPDRNVTAWFYPTAEGGYAAAVWFRPEKKSGEPKAYQVKYEAVTPEDPGGEGE